MGILEEKLVPWQGTKRQTGEAVYRRVGNGLDAALEDAYRAASSDFKGLPPEVLAREHRKFQQICLGDFSADYFRGQREIVSGISKQTSYVDYFGQVYAAYAAGLVSALIGRRRFGAGVPRAMLLSLMQSVFADVAVVAHTYFETMQAEAAQARVKTLQATASAFEREVAGHITDVSSGAQDMLPAVEQLAQTTRQTQEQAMTASAAAHQATANAQAVASATEELTASIGEIARQVEEAARFSATAAEQAQKTNGMVDALSQASMRIGEVVRLITDIASRTNLLALNATIEAARAGDAGKGFAVVAGEVKALANQTAKATDEIGNQINAMQSETNRTVEAIRSISGVIEEIKQVSARIAAAVEEQGTATQEISRNVEQTAAANEQLSGSVTQIDEAARSADARNREVLEFCRKLTEKSRAMGDVVKDFVANIATRSAA